MFLGLDVLLVQHPMNYVHVCLRVRLYKKYMIFAQNIFKLQTPTWIAFLPYLFRPLMLTS